MSVVADRYFLPKSLRGGVVELSGDEAKHLVRVARRQVGDVVELFDGQGIGVTACIVAISKESASLEIREVVADREPVLSLTLASAVPKGDRFDWMIEKATELGVTRLVPLRTERSVVDPRGAKLDRLRRVIIEASKQSGRSRLMVLDEPRSLDEYLADEPADSRLIAHAGGVEVSGLSSIAIGQTTALAIGPEGGWADSEVERAVVRGWTVVGLGTTRLRVETAAIAGAALLINRGTGSGS